MKAYLYDVFSADGSMIISEVTSRQISDALGIPMKTVSTCSNSGILYNGKYRFKRSGKYVGKEEKENTIPKSMFDEWDEVRKLFSNVKWVKEYEPGVRKLR